MSSLRPGRAGVRACRGTPQPSRPLRPAPPGSRRARAGTKHTRDDRSRGQSLVELALVTPILLLLLLGAIDLGRLFYAQITVTNAAREGAMVAALTPTSFSAGSACDASSNAVTCAAIREGQGGFVSVAPADVAMTCDPACAKTYGTTVTVTVTGHFQLLTPILWAFTGGPNVTFNRDATADVIVTPAASNPSASPSSSPSASPNASASASPSPTPSPSPTCAPPFVGFTVKISGNSGNVSFTSTSTPTSGVCAISFYNWDFGDGNTAAGNSLTTTSNNYPKGGGSYPVTLAVRTPGGVFTYVATVTP